MKRGLVIFTESERSWSVKLVILVETPGVAGEPNVNDGELHIWSKLLSGESYGMFRILHCIEFLLIAMNHMH